MSKLPNPQALAQQFADEVWTEEFGNVSSQALIEAWAQIFTTYNNCIGKNQREERPVCKQVLPLSTGAGKSQATIFYLQQLENVEHVGVLVVSYFEEEAKSACITINRKAYGTADYHSKKHPLSGERIDDTQVLYITHAQYLLALQEPARMKRLISFKNQPRQLIIIDEQISQVKDHEFTALNAGTLRSKIQTLLDSDLEISNEDRQGLEDEKLFLEEVRDLIKQSDATTANGVMLSLKEQSLLYRDVGQFKYFSEYAKGGDRSFLAKVDEGVAFDVIKKLTNTLKAIQSQEISYARSSGGEVYINSLEWLNIHEHHAVVLDATASVDYIYSLHDDVSIHQIPKQLRQYDNVTLHISEQAYNLGKNQLQELEPATLFNSLASLIEQVCPQLPDPILDGNLFDINTTEETSREEVLIILPKAVREKVEKHYESSLHDYLELHHVDLHFAHWGNITGKNDYRHCSKVIIASLPFKPANHITNLHITSKRGLKAIRQHNGEKLPNEIEEERTKIEYGTMAAEVIQAINRVRCRSVINEQGQCQETDIYLFKTHDGGLHESLISAITDNMKGIQVRELSALKLPDACLYGGTNKRGPKTDTNDKLFIKVMSEQPAKRYSLKELMNITGKGRDAINRILDDLEKHCTDDYDEDNLLHQFCDSYTVKIEPRGSRGRVLVKGL